MCKLIFFSETLCIIKISRKFCLYYSNDMIIQLSSLSHIKHYEKKRKREASVDAAVCCPRLVRPFSEFTAIAYRAQCLD